MEIPVKIKFQVRIMHLIFTSKTNTTMARQNILDPDRYQTMRQDGVPQWYHCV